MKCSTIRSKEPGLTANLTDEFGKCVYETKDQSTWAVCLILQIIFTNIKIINQHKAPSRAKVFDSVFLDLNGRCSRSDANRY